MTFIPANRNVADFFFRYGRWSWKERFYDVEANSLDATLAKAKTLAPLRIQMLAFNGVREGSPYLHEIVVSNDAVLQDSKVTTEFQYNTGKYAADFVDEQAADPRFVMNWRTSNTNGFGRNRYLAGISLSVLASHPPELNGNLLPLFTKFQFALSDGGFGYYAAGSGPLGPTDYQVSLIEFDSPNLVKVWSGTLPNQGEDIELHYGRFVKKTPPVRGSYTVVSVGTGFFRLFQGPAASQVQFLSPGLWRRPVTRVIPFDGSAIMTGIGIHQRGYKEHAEHGRVRARGSLIF